MQTQAGPISQANSPKPRPSAPPAPVPAPPTPPSAQLVEKIPTTVYESSAVASRAVAQEIADLIRGKSMLGQRCVLGLATGSTPTGVYTELVRMHQDEGLSFANVVTFNLDEYYP